MRLVGSSPSRKMRAPFRLGKPSTQYLLSKACCSAIWLVYLC